MRSLILVTLLAGCWPAFCPLQRAVAQPADEEDDDPYRAGLIGLYRGADGNSLRRLDDVLAFDWGAAPPDRRLAAGPFQATWNGYLMSQAAGQYQLHAFFAGRLQIKLDGQTLLDAQHADAAWRATEPLELPFDFHPLEIHYARSGASGRLALFWSGPQFELEPISARQFYHDPPATPDADFQRGASLVRSLRCAGCHQIAGEPPRLPAPALDRLAGNIRPDWLVDWLVGPRRQEESLHQTEHRRMPHFGLSRDEAQAIGAYLLQSRAAPASNSAKPARAKKKNSAAKKKDPANKVDPVAAGERLFLTIGCLACHSLGDLGTRGPYAGGDLTQIAAKRPSGFFDRWLTDPAALNRDHRMPLFDLPAPQPQQLAAFLATLTGDGPAGESGPGGDKAAAAELVARGVELVRRHRCAACHQLADAQHEAAVAKVKLSASSRWAAGCFDEPDGGLPRPGFHLAAADRRAIVSFIRAVSPAAPGTPAPSLLDGRRLIAEQNCLACHARDPDQGIAGAAAQVAAVHRQLAPLLPAMTPPSLNNVGDKLHASALAAVIRRQGPPRRSYLQVQMPKFRLSDDELAAIVRYFAAADRIPQRPAGARPLDLSARDNDVAWRAAASRLVTADGFGCTSCHQIGDVLPAQAPIAARGPDLSHLSAHIRRPWFDRFLRNPARIVPRMEMPSVRVAVRGVLADDLEQQLAAVWHVLARPGFRPPEPNPVRVVRRAGIADRHERAVVITDVVQTPDRSYVKPLLIGLPNRHNVLFDLESGRLARWTLGDVARQRTQGKTWFWEDAGHVLLETQFDEPEIKLIRDGRTLPPQPRGQFVTEFTEIEHAGGGIGLRYDLHFGDGGEGSRWEVTQSFEPIFADASSGDAGQLAGVRRRLSLPRLPAGAALRLQLLSSARMADTTRRAGLLVLENGSRIRVVAPAGAAPDASGAVTVPGPAAKLELEYLSPTAADRFPLVAPQPDPLAAEPLQVAPGFDAVRLPLSEEIMPTALDWRPGGELVIASLKGRVWIARDRDGDGLEDDVAAFSDELAAPYGLAAYDDYIDVLNKYALLRLFDEDGDGQADRTLNVASGWGHTADYHDWAVGLVRDGAGNYYVALPCQQDQRSEAAAHLRGHVLRLVPRAEGHLPPRFAIESVSAGHRFPMGIARDRQGELFVTDNQGNYNPFNELNHVRAGRRYGFINALERRPGFQPPLTPPAIDIPHPWTRSVNGICFLDTPPPLRRRLGHDRFGPFEGHLVGCEYDTRRLIRMSLHKVGDTYQGAAYPFSYDEPPRGPPLLGPLVCAVAPDGDLYVGGIRDSGWGGGNNVGELVRLRPAEEGLPCGIAEVRATPDGFQVWLTAAADPRLAADPKNYALLSYTRVSTPAYGGADQGRRSESIRSVSVAEDARSVKLTLDELRAGFVYELRLRNLAGPGRPFFPAEAHYTLRAIPE